MGGAWIVSYHIPDDKSLWDLRNLHELRGKRLVAQVSRTRRFALYSQTGVVLMLRLESSWHGRSVDRVITYSGRQIAVGSQKPSRITRQNTRCASELNTSIRVVFPKRSGFDAPIGVVLAWEERGSCLNVLRTTNRGRVSETFTNYEAKDLLRKSVDHVLTYSGRQIAVRSQKPSRITRQKTCCASESNTSVRVVFPNGSGFDAPIGVVFAWEERGSCLNIFRTTNRGKRPVAQVSQTRRFALHSRTGVVLMLRLESSRHGRSVDHVFASESNASVRVVLANRSGFDAPIGVVLAWEERGSCLNIFRTTNRGRISETFTNYEAKDLLRKNLHELRGKRLVAQVSQTRRFPLYSRTGVVLRLRLESSWRGRSVDHVLTYSGGQIAVGSQKPSRITRQKTCCASESNTSVRVVFANGVVLMLRLKSSWHGRSVDHVSTYSGRQNAVGSQKPSRITRQNTCCARESNTSGRVVLANRSGFDATIGVVSAWEERGSCLNISRTTNRGRISETFKNYEAKDLLRKSVDHVLTYFGRQIAVGSQKPSRITRQRTCCASESNTSVQVVFANGSGFEAPIGVVLAWEERGSCLNIFLTTNRGWSSENFTNYEAKDLFRNRLGMGGAWIMSQHIPDDKSRSRLRNLHELRGKRLVAQVSQARRFGLYSRTGVVLMLRLESSWDGRSVDHVLTYSGRQIAVGSQKPSRITRQKTCCASESNTLVCVGFFLKLRLESSWHGRSVDQVLTYSGRQIAVGSQKPSRITRQKTCCACESNTSVPVVFTNGSGLDAPIGVVLAWQERGSCLNIFRTKNRGRISETFTNYEAKHLLRK
ncbi:uncharacterized protein G2W53_009779 [Senna tora]|uniref:Uncharacterized protein n=1 Tax=Senna tora TaxID=362788 RepID=A0A834WY32_9FABA|nr:uncharacterized protein G2W53_009779 [Senna tora]